MKKSELIKKLDELHIDYLEEDSVDVLRQKLNQSVQAKMSLSIKDDGVPYLLMDMEDEGQIVQELSGNIIQHYVYSFEDKDGKKVIGLSKAGVDQVCRESANRGEVYRTLSVSVTEDEESYKCIATAARYSLTFDKDGKPTGEVLLDTSTGAKRQMKMKFKKNGGSYPDPFAYEICVTKAQRNAKKSLLPYKLVEELIKKYIENGSHVRVIRTSAKINDSQLKLLHGVASRKGLSHDDLKAIVNKEFGLNSLLDLEMSQCDRMITIINESKTSHDSKFGTARADEHKDSPEQEKTPPDAVSGDISGVPDAVLKAGFKCGFSKFKILAYWNSALAKFKDKEVATVKCIGVFTEKESENLGGYNE